MPEIILLVDDDARLVDELKHRLGLDGYDVLAAASGCEALQIIELTRPSLIVSSAALPGSDGFTLVESVRARFDWITIPFIFLTAPQEDDTQARGRALGVEDYLTKPFAPDDLLRAVQARLARTNVLQVAHDTEAVIRTLVVMAKTIEARDRYTAGHVERVCRSAQALARALGWDEARVAELRLATILHDIGKITISDAVLNKAGPLSPDEWRIMRTHPQVGADIVSSLDSLPLVIDGVYCHHERFDGQGYPRGLAGEAIPEVGRLLGVVDAFDAMTNDRAYRPRLSRQAALVALQDGAGEQFDPLIARTFIERVQVMASEGGVDRPSDHPAARLSGVPTGS